MSLGRPWFGNGMGCQTTSGMSNNVLLVMHAGSVVPKRGCYALNRRSEDMILSYKHRKL